MVVPELLCSTCFGLPKIGRDERIISTLWRQWGWSYFKEMIYLKNPLKRAFYAEMCRLER